MTRTRIALWVAVPLAAALGAWWAGWLTPQLPQTAPVAASAPAPSLGTLGVGALGRVEPACATPAIQRPSLDMIMPSRFS